MKRTISVLIILVMVLYSFTAMAFAVGPPMMGDLDDNGKEFTNWKAAYTQEQLMAMRGRALKDRIRVHGNHLNFDVPPVIKEGRTLIPVRAITNGMGAEVEWDAATKLITITRDEIKIEFKLGDMFLTVWNDGVKEIVEMDYPASLMNNRTFVPLRFIAEALGDKVGYDKDTGDIDVLTKLATPDRPWWDGTSAEWNIVEHADVYKVRLFNEGNEIDTVTTSALSFNFTGYMDEEDEEGCYTVRVTALATDEYSKSRESKPSYTKNVGECENITLIEGLIYALDDEDGMVEITKTVDSVITKVYVTKNTEIVIEGLAGDFDDLDIGDAVVATLHDDDLIKLVVDNE
jgi:hypothetical protein